MKLDITTKKSKKDKKIKSEDGTDVLQEVLKKPRTRSVSMTLSENGIDEDMTQLSAKGSEEKQSPAKKEKKSKKVKKSEGEEETNGEKKKKKKKSSDAENDIPADTTTPKKKKKSKLNGTAETSPKKSESKTEEEVADDGVPPEHAAGRFSNFPIREKTIAKLKAKGINYLFPIQVETYKKVLEGEDTIAKARTGTGKTLAFALPLMEKLESGTPNKTRGRAPRVIVLAPTRELVNQVAKDFKDLRSSTINIQAFYGGVPLGGQGNELRSGIDILIGTPGRVLDWVGRGVLDTSKLEHVVLDEVDQMLDMGFADDVEKIISHSYKEEAASKPQTLFFSATMPAWVKKTAAKYMKKMPPVIDLVGNSLNQTSSHVTHLAVKSNWTDLPEVLGKLVQYYTGDSGRAMIFCDTKRKVDELSISPEIKLAKQKLHGDVPQASRERVLQEFREGIVKVLVTTNVAARGLDIPEVDVVIQTSPPTDIESYIHRSGRTGRAGKSGVSICIYGGRTEHDLIRVERSAKLSFKRVNVPTADDMMNRGMTDIKSSIEEIGADVIEKFTPLAEELIESKGAKDAVAALLAIATGQTTITNHSLISGRNGFVTFLYRTTTVIQYKGYVYNMIRKIDENLSNKVASMRLCKDKMGAVFDLPEDEMKQWEESLTQKNANDSLERATTLPELESQGSFGGGYQSQGGQRYGGGGFNRGSRGGGFGGHKRSFGSSEPVNKRQKFY